eukprot:9185416-Lingulodinium_polyedra.AAC.1
MVAIHSSRICYIVAIRHASALVSGVDKGAKRSFSIHQQPSTPPPFFSIAPGLSNQQFAYTEPH